MLAAHRNVVLVGNCRGGWAADVYGWDANHVESGSTPGYRAYPGCDASYGPAVYAAKFVRYYEDSTWLSAAIDPGQTPADHEAGSLTPERVAAMVACGVNLFGFDQFDPNDGRVAASIFSWAPGQPDAAAGACAVQRRRRPLGLGRLRPAAARRVPHGRRRLDALGAGPGRRSGRGLRGRGRHVLAPADRPGERRAARRRRRRGRPARRLAVLQRVERDGQRQHQPPVGVGEPVAELEHVAVAQLADDALVGAGRLVGARR